MVTANSDGNVGAWNSGQLVVGQAAASGASSGAIGISYSTTNNAGYISSLSPTTAWRDLGFRALNTMFYYNGATEGMRLTTGGNLGIGNTGPTEKLEVSGAIKIAGASATDNNSPALTLVSDDDFLYDGEYINHYALGFHQLMTEQA